MSTSSQLPPEPAQVSSPEQVSSIGQARTTALATPEILSHILLFLRRDRIDLGACRLVSTLFNAVATPIYLQTMDLPVGGGISASRPSLCIPDGFKTRIRQLRQPGTPTINMWDDDVDTAFLNSHSSRSWESLRTWRAIDDSLGSGFELTAQHQQHPGWSAVYELLKRNRSPQACGSETWPLPYVNLSFGLTNVAQVHKILRNVPAFAASISKLHVVADSFRHRDRTPPLTDVERARLNSGYRSWGLELESLLETICKAQPDTDRRFKEFHIETEIGFAVPFLDVISSVFGALMPLLPSWIEALTVRLQPPFTGIDVHRLLLGQIYPRLRKINIQGFGLDGIGRVFHDWSARVDNFLQSHPSLEEVCIYGPQPLALACTIPNLKTLALNHTSVQVLAPFLMRHPLLRTLSVTNLVDEDNFCMPNVDFSRLHHITDWRMPHRVLIRLIEHGLPIKEATARDLETLADLVICPHLPAHRQPVVESVTFLEIHVWNDTLIQLIAQLGNTFHFSRFPNLAELSLGLSSNDALDITMWRHSNSSSVLFADLILLGLAQATSLRALHISFGGFGTGLTASDNEDDEPVKLVHFPPALEYFTWRWLDLGVAQHYRVIRILDLYGGSVRRLHKLPSTRFVERDGLWLTRSKSTILDHTSDVPFLPC